MITNIEEERERLFIFCNLLGEPQKMDVKFNYFLLEIFMHLHYYVEDENGMILEVSGNKAIFVLVPYVNPTVMLR